MRCDSIRWFCGLEFDNKLEALKYFRAKIDLIPASKVIWDPYGVVDPYKDCPMALYHDCLHYLEKVESYMANRVTRQFGYTQVIPKEFIKPTRNTYKGHSLKKHKVYYTCMLSQ